MELPLPQLTNQSKSEAKIKADIIAEQFMRFLDQEGYRIELGADTMLRVCGVSDGELMFALRCKVYKVEIQEK